MKYFIIIDIKTIKKIYNTLRFYIYNYGLSLIIFIYSNSNSLIEKNLAVSQLKLNARCIFSKNQ